MHIFHPERWPCHDKDNQRAVALQKAIEEMQCGWHDTCSRLGLVTSAGISYSRCSFIFVFRCAHSKVLFYRHPGHIVYNNSTVSVMRTNRGRPKLWRGWKSGGRWGWIKPYRRSLSQPLPEPANIFCGYLQQFTMGSFKIDIQYISRHDTAKQAWFVD